MYRFLEAIIEQDGVVCGYIAIAITHYFHRKKAFLRIIAMIVDKKYRRKGIGKLLMQKAENYALETNCSHIELSSGVHRVNLGSHDFYRSLGYVELNDIKKILREKTKQ